LRWRGAVTLLAALVVNSLIAFSLVLLGRFGIVPVAEARPERRAPIEVAWISPDLERPVKTPAPEAASPRKPKLRSTVPVKPASVEPEAALPAPRLSLGVALDLPELPSIAVDPTASIDSMDLNVLTAARPPEPERTALPQTGPLDENGVDVRPEKRFSPAPEFPRLALRRNIMRGRVRTLLLVTEKGRVARIKILDARPRGYFEGAVREAVGGWTFSPARLRGRAVACWCNQEFCFRVKH